MSVLASGALLSLASCAQWSSLGTDGASLAGSRWRLVEASFAPVQSLGPQSTLTLEFKGNRLHAFGGCNGASSDYALANDRIETGPIASTRRACLAQESNRIERDYFALLQAGPTYSLRSGDLILQAAGQRARFRAAKP